MIRRAIREDTPEIMDLIREYYEGEGLLEKSGIPCDELSLEYMIRSHSIFGGKCCFVDDREGRIVGVASGVLSPWPTDTLITVAQETLVYGEDVEALRNEFDVWAMEKGASLSMVSCFTEGKDRFRKLVQGGKECHR